MPVTLLDSLKLIPCCEDALQPARDLAIGARQDAIEKLDHGDLAAEPPPDRAELEADDAGADHQEASRHLGKVSAPVDATTACSSMAMPGSLATRSRWR